MVKLEAIESFTLRRFDEIKIVERKGTDLFGFLEQGDVFECSKDLADYLLGDNAHNRAFVKVLEIIPEKKETKEEPYEPDSKNAKIVKIPTETIKH